jgi:hypothetical protein
MLRSLAAAIVLLAAAAPAAAAAPTLVHLTDGTGPDSGDNAFLRGVSDETGRAFVETAEPLLPADTDTAADVYAREPGGGLTLLTDGPSPVDPNVAASFRGASDDGSRMVFVTAEALTAVTDTDTVGDVYRRNGDGSLSHMSDSTADAPFAAEVFRDAVPADGGRVTIVTQESHDDDDDDSAQDAYAREITGILTLVSDGAGLDDERSVDAVAVSSDGQVIALRTSAQLSADDTDDTLDVYAVTGSAAPVVVSDAPGGGPDPDVEASYLALAEDGGRIVLETDEPLLPASDTDTRTDVYAATPAGSLTLLSDGPSADGPFHALFRDGSSDLERVVFETEESLVADDTDAVADVYARNADASLSAISDTPGADPDVDAFFEASSPDGSSVLFDTEQSLAPSDGDAEGDAYDRAPDGSLRHVSDSPGADAAQGAFGTAVADGAVQAFFETAERLAPTDTDGSFDSYARGSLGGLTHLSDGTGADGGFDAELEGASADGTRAYLATEEALLPSDTDTARDVYAVVGIENFTPPPAPPPGPGPQPGPGPGPGPLPPLPPGPEILAAASRLSLTPSAFRAARNGPSVVAGRSAFAWPSARPAAFRRAPRSRRRAGATVRYRLTTAARVRFTVEREARGRRVRGRCVEPRRSNRRRPRCVRFVAVRGSFTHDGAAGANSLRFSGRVGGRRLSPGRYRLTATPAGGGRAATASFRIVR